MKRNFGHEDAGLATPETLDSIVKNFTIDSFLESNDKRYLVGPKGSGKTLLLLRKAIDQRKKGGAICIPSDSDLPVDRLTAVVRQPVDGAVSRRDAGPLRLRRRAS